MQSIMHSSNSEVKGNWYTFKGENYVRTVLIPIWKWGLLYKEMIYFKREQILSF